MMACRERGRAHSRRHLDHRRRQYRSRRDADAAADQHPHADHRDRPRRRRAGDRPPRGQAVRGLPDACRSSSSARGSTAAPKSRLKQPAKRGRRDAGDRSLGHGTGRASRPTRQSETHDRRTACPLHRARPDAGARRPDRRALPRRLGRQLHQGRDAARRRRHGHGRAAPRARLPEPAPQQALDHAQPQGAGRPGHLHEAGREGRRGGRELPRRREVPPRHRLREPEEGEPAHHPGLDLGLRPGRALCRARGLRPDRPGHGRHHVGHRHAGRRPGARRHRRGRRRRGPALRHRHPDRRCSSARCRAQGQWVSTLAAAGHDLDVRLPGGALDHRQGRAGPGRQQPSDLDPDRRVQDQATATSTSPRPAATSTSASAKPSRRRS